MKKINRQEVLKYVEENIATFHQQRVDSLNNLKLLEVIARKNPYLLKAKYLLTTGEIVSGLTDAHISSNEETIFNNWLKGLAIFVNSKVYGGYKSGITGIDLEFNKDGIRYIVTIKSGPNWGNASQIAKMIEDFKTAKLALRTSNSKLNITAVNGCCYGRNNKTDKGEYYKYCGQRFWEFISGDSELFTEIIDPLGYKAKEKSDVFMASYSQMINRFIKAFADTYCKDNGEIDWKKLVIFNSAIERPPK